MTTYTYRARDRTGRIVRGRLPARDERELRDRLRAEKLYLVEARPPRRTLLPATPRMSGRDLIQFTFELQSLVASGIPLLSGLDDMARQTAARGFRETILELRGLIERGATLSQAMSRLPRAFPRSYARMIEAGETSGRLDETLGRLLTLLEWRQELKAQMRQLATYPLIVLTGVLGLVTLLMTYVVPRYRGMLESFNVELPAITRYLISVSVFVTDNIFWIAVGLVSCVLGMVLLPRIGPARLQIDSLLLRLPVIGPLILGLNSSKVAHFLGAFVESGVPIGIALDLLAGVTGNRRISRSLQSVRSRVLEGATLTGAFEAERIFPPLVQRMVAIGETTGELVAALHKVRAYYDRELPRRVQRIFDLVGPAVTVVLGMVLLVVILAVLLPVYRMYSAINVVR